MEVLALGDEPGLARYAAESHHLRGAADGGHPTARPEKVRMMPRAAGEISRGQR